VHGVEDLPLLLPAAEVVILLVPLTAETRGMVDRAFLAALDDGALLVNAARGPVVDTAALLPELASGRLRAALDVTDPEPLPPGDPLWHTSGVLITPHVAAFTDGMLDRVYTLVAEQLGRHLVGQPLRNRVVR
jgi:phosphoglycerate dehydrogenase-like enzyme